jgi:hypothetical protein
MKKHFRLGCLETAFAIVWMAAEIVRAGIAPPLYVGNSTAVTNALGRNLPGSWAGGPTTAARVEIREMGSGIVPPDIETGAGNDAANPLVRVSYIGNNVLGSNPGKFSEIFTNRLEDGKSYFARVYDDPSASAALYYADSASFQDVPPDQRNTVTSVGVFFQALRLVNGEEDADTDGDGIPDAMENEVTGTSPTQWDTDGDGFNDYFEVMHSDYLDPKISNPIDLLIHAPENIGAPFVLSGPHSVSWWTIPGVFYRLGYYALAEDAADYIEIWSGTATETNLEVDVQDSVDTESQKGFFRVFAVP